MRSRGVVTPGVHGGDGGIEDLRSEGAGDDDVKAHVQLCSHTAIRNSMESVKDRMSLENASATLCYSK